MGLLNLLSGAHPQQAAGDDPYAVKKPGIFTYLMRGPVGYDQQQTQYIDYAKAQQDQQDTAGLFAAERAAGDDPTAQRQAALDYIAPRPRLAKQGLDLLAAGKPIDLAPNHSLYAPGHYDKPLVTAPSATGGEDDPALLTDHEAELGARQYVLNGTLPTFGMGPVAAANKNKIYKAAVKYTDMLGFTPTQVMVNRGSFAADEKSLKALTTTMDQVSAYEDTTQRNLTVAESLLDKAKLTNSPLANVWRNRFRKDIQGDPDLAAYNAALQGALDEYTKVVAGTTGGSAPASDAARRAIEDRLSTASTPAQVRAVFARMRQEMKNRTQSQVDHIGGIRKRMLGYGGEGAAPSPSPAPPDDKPDGFHDAGVDAGLPPAGRPPGPRDAAALRSNPGLKAQFDAKFGAGAAARVLSGR